MTAHPSVRGTWTLFLGTLLLGCSWAAVQGQELPPEIDSDGVQTLTRGPVHEAFASPAIADPKPGLIVPKRPPADIQEQPPEYQPEGVNVQWFPGYWAWDEDRDDFIWISGAWRDPPPGKRWVPGYWAEVNGQDGRTTGAGFQWVAGFWIDEAVEEMEYLKPPPQSVDQGPSVAAPGDDYFYVPGNWTYTNNDYRWSPGYWAPYREDWVYVQPHWVWTPRGCVFVAGYWDWRVPRRGQIFAPIYVTPVVYQRPHWHYTPRCVINTSNLFVHLWVRDSYCHYYFGNYYGPSYANRHFTPWCNYTSRPRCYDPLFSYCNVHYRRQGIDYAHRMQGWHNHYVTHTNERPANTWREQNARHDHDHRASNFANARPAILAQDLKDVLRAPDHNHQWKRQDVAGKDLSRQSIDQIKQLHQLRLNQEKVSLANREIPGRNLPDRDANDRDNPSDRTKGLDLKLPANGPKGGLEQNPADKIPAAQQALAGKIKLPKPTVSSRLPNQAKIAVPEMPEKALLSRPITRPNVLENPSRLPGLRNPAAEVTRPKLDTPANSSANIEKPSSKPLDVQPLDTKPLTSRESTTTREPKKLDLGGANVGGTSKSATNSLQQKLDSIRQQQQDALNAARNRANVPVGPQVAPDLGGKSRGSLETPRNSLPKIETPKRDVAPITRPPLSSGSNNVPRNLGGNLGGSSQPKINVAPRNVTPSVQPRSFTPPISKPTIDRTPAPRQNLQVPQSAPRNLSVPRSNPQPRIGGANPGGNSNGNHSGGADRRRGR